MICFLTSSPCPPGVSALNPANGFVDSVLAALPTPCRGLFICSDPDSHDKTDLFGGDMRRFFSAAGVSFSGYEVLDGRNAEAAGELVKWADVIILAGGHVPTQNAFFQKIRLRQLLAGFGGAVIGISAGTMNAADVVYAQPELPGESVDPDFLRFLPGLGLTGAMVLPHYGMIKDDVLDGRRLFEDITYPDSYGRHFFALPDGSYIFSDGGAGEIRGEAYLIENGSIRQICADGESYPLE